jgi:hypothetical protein
LLAKPVIGTFASQTEYEQEMQKEYNRVARKVMYKQDFENAPIMYSAVGSGTLPGTDWEVNTGTHKIATSTVNGKSKKVHSTTTAGFLSVPAVHGNSAYGTWEFWFNKAAGSNLEVMLVANKKTTRATSGMNGYLFYASTTEQIGLYTVINGSASALMLSAASYFTDSTWYQAKITRTTEGVFSLYLRAEGQPYSLVSVSGGSGSNPATNTIYTTSNYYTIDNDAGDKITDFTKYFGVI